MRKSRGRSGVRRSRIDFQLEAKARQAAKLAELREALVAAGYDTTAVIGPSRIGVAAEALFSIGIALMAWPNGAAPSEF